MASVGEYLSPQCNTNKRTIPINIPSMDSSNSSSPASRPQSALRRGVKITEFQPAREMNPEPIMPEESEYLLEEYLSPRKLKLLTGMDDLREVHYLEMKVDTRDTSLGNFGMHLPNLTQLKLSNSIITQTRDLGTCLDGVRVLWMAQCGLEDIDGLCSMYSLKELYLAYNEITDISPCSMLEQLQILDLEGNAISDITQVEFLALCQKLENLTLEGNPICTTPGPDQTSTGYNYRRSVRRAIPHLTLLDDEALQDEVDHHEEEDDDEKGGFVFDADWDLINEFYADGTIMDRDEVLEEELLPAARPGTSSIRPATGYRPGSALKPYTAAISSSRHGSRPLANRPGTSHRPGSGGVSGPGTAAGGSRGSSRESGSRPGTAGRAGGSIDDLEHADDSSSLTQGGVVCGNISKALRMRSSGKGPANKETLKAIQQMKYKPEHTYDQAQEDDETMKELLAELKEWKSEYHKQRELIQATKAPQVLTIEHEHDDAISLSGESIDSGSEDNLADDFELSLPKELLKSDSTPPPPDSGISSDQGYDGMGAKPKKHSNVGASPNARRRLRLRHDESYDIPRSPPSTCTPPTPPSGSKLKPQRIHHNQTNGASATTSSSSSSSNSKSHSLSVLRSPSPLMVRADSADRPTSGPEQAGQHRGKFKLGPVVDKSRPKVIDSQNPIVRASLTSPDKLVPEGPRAFTAKAALGGPPSMQKIRKGQLANVALLPSKPPNFTRSDSKS